MQSGGIGGATGLCWALLLSIGFATSLGLFVLQDWPSAHRQLIRLLDGQVQSSEQFFCFFFHVSPTRPWLQVGANVLAEELDRVASSFTGRQCRAISALSERAQTIQCNARRLGTGNVDLHSDCIPGRFSLELLMLLTHPGFNRTDGAMSLVRSKVTLGQLNSCEYSGPFDGVWNASWHDSGL